MSGVEDARADLACASSGNRAHPVFGLGPVHLASELSAAGVEEGVREVDIWTARHRLVEVAFATDPDRPAVQHQSP